MLAGGRLLTNRSVCHMMWLRAVRSAVTARLAALARRASSTQPRTVQHGRDDDQWGRDDPIGR